MLINKTQSCGACCSRIPNSMSRWLQNSCFQEDPLTLRWKREEKNMQNLIKMEELRQVNIGYSLANLICIWGLNK